MTETESNQIAVDAEMRRRQKVANIKAKEAKPVADTLAPALNRLAQLQAQPQPERAPEDNGKIVALRLAANLSPRHDKRIERVQSPWQEKQDAIQKRLGSGFMVAIVGEQGSGKTQFGHTLIRAATMKLTPCLFATAMEFFLAIKESFDSDRVSESAAIRRFTKPALLVLDEMDERSESAWENRLLFHAINKRYNDMVDTLLISRRSKQEFMESVGPSIQSRIKESGGCIEASWGSFR